MKLRHFVLLLGVSSLGFVLQQFAHYTSLKGELNTLNGESARLVSPVDSAMYNKESILQQLNETEQRYNRLRVLLPEELQEGVVEQRVTALARKYGIKVLAIKTAINSRSFYREATIDITLEANDTQGKQFIHDFKALPRIINLETPELRGKKNLHLSISIYAADTNMPPAAELPRCIGMPPGILLPPLRERLTSQYADYIKQCRYVSDYSELYLKRLHLQALQDEISRLKTIVDKLPAANTK
jgi:Tfp pilus assembly protein PilO